MTWFLLALLACGDDGGPDDTATTDDTGTTTADDSGETASGHLDQDHDGYKADDDCDGIDDVLIGSPDYTTLGYEEGRAFILLSSDW